ncbi:hypothetical protein [Planomonospora algeriensis]
MQVAMRLSALVALVGAVAVGCSTNNDRTPVHYTVTEEVAKSHLNEIAAYVSSNGVARLCEHFGAPVDECSKWLDEARDDCLYPGPPPVVARSAEIPSTKGRSQGWVLAIQGKTEDGQRYASEIAVTMENGRPVANVPVYWLGVGLEDSPFGPGNTVIPKPNCD